MINCVLLFLDCYTLYPHTGYPKAAVEIPTMTVRDCALYCELEEECTSFTIIQDTAFYWCSIITSSVVTTISEQNTQLYKKRSCDIERMYYEPNVI